MSWLKQIITVILFILVVMAINFPAYRAVSTDAAMLNTLSLDEWVNIDFLNNQFYRLLDAKSYRELLALRDNVGYGTIFYYVYGLLTYPIYHFGTFQLEIITLRLISAAWLGIILFFVYKIIFLYTQKTLPSVLGAIMILTMPAYYFYAKAFSVEFMGTGLLVASIYYLLKDNFTYKKNLYLALFLFASAIGTKASAIIILPVAIIYLLVGLHWLSWQNWFLKIIIGSCIGLTGFLISNPFVITSSGGTAYYVMLLQRNIQDNKTGHGAIDVTSINYISWYTKGIHSDYMVLPFITLFIIGYLLWIIFLPNNKKRLQAILLFSISVLFILYIIFTVKKIWTWYLFPGFTLLPVGLAAWSDDIFLHWKKYHLKIITLIICFLGLLLTNHKTIASHYSALAESEQSADFQIKVRSKQTFNNWLTTQNFHNISILKSPYVYFDETPYDHFTINPFWGKLSEWHFTYYEPNMILLEKWVFAGIQQDPKHFFNGMIDPEPNSGYSIDNKLFRYKKSFETENFYVFVRY